MVNPPSHEGDANQNTSFEVHPKSKNGRRVNTRNLIALCACGSAFLIAIVYLSALRPTPQKSNPVRELIPAKTPELLKALPKSYEALPPQPTSAHPPIYKQKPPLPQIETAFDKKIRTAPLFVRITHKGKNNTTPSINSSTLSKLTQQKKGQSQSLANILPSNAANTSEEDQNKQAEKRAFLTQKADPSIYNPYVQQKPISPYQVMAGTLIPAALITGLNSDLPGKAIAQVTQPVYDTVTGQYLLIPQGSRIIGTYDSVIAFGQSRALVIWQRLILPNGVSIRLNNLPAVDASGYTGLEDEVDVHTWRLIKGIALSTLLNIGSNISIGADDGDLVNILRISAAGGVSQAGDKIVSRNLNIQPTLKVRPGWPLQIIVHQDLILTPYV